MADENICRGCQGSGKCPACDGTGQQRGSGNKIHQGDVSIGPEPRASRACSKCMGTGTCQACLGAGVLA